MSWFSKKRLLTSSQVMHMIEDTPDIIPQAVLNALLDNREVVSDILDSVNGSIATKVQQYYAYGKRHYTNGLPEGSIGYQAIEPNLIRGALDADRPSGPDAINVITSVGLTDEPSIHSIAIDWLVSNKSDFSPINLTWTENGKLVTYSNATLQTPTTILIVYKWQEPNAVQSGSLSFTPDYAINPNEEYYVVTYEVFSRVTQAKLQDRFWFYRINSNKYPDMEPPRPIKDSYYFPVVPIRINNEDYFAKNRRDTELYYTSTQLLKTIGLDALQIAEGINANPDIDKIDHAYFVLGVNPKSNKAGVDNYLYRFFKDMAAKSKTSKEVFMKWFNSYTPLGYAPNDPPINTISISDNTYNVALAWNYVNITLVKGTIGNKGAVTKLIDANHGTLERVVGTGGGARKITIENPDNKLIIKKQVTSDYYEELEISGLMFSNRIYGPNVDYISTLASNKEGEEVVIPLNLTIMNKVPKLEANTLFYDSILLVINAFEYKKLKWYQTGFFKIVTAILAVAISIFSGGLGTLVSGLITAAAAGVTALAVFVGEMVLTTLAASYAFKFAAEHLNIEVLAIIAAVTAVYGFIGGKGLLNLPFADTLMQVSTLSSKAMGEAIKKEFTDLAIEGAKFAEEAKDAMEELKEIQKELSPDFYLDPLGLYTQVGMTPAESPNDFLYRSIGLPNPGVVSLDAITNFVDNSLRLA